MIFEVKRYLRSRRGKLLLETAVYGMLTAIYTSLFFFGALYPQFGIPAQSISCEEEEETTKEETKKEEKDITEEEEAERITAAEEKTEDPDADEEAAIVYKSLFLERLKEWF